MGDRDDPDDVMETSLTIDYDKQWLNCVAAISPQFLTMSTTVGEMLAKMLLLENHFRQLPHSPRKKLLRSMKIVLLCN